MSVSSIADFLQNMACADLAAFGHRLRFSEWKILLALGKGTAVNAPTEDNGQSYKSLRCACALSDDALSRGLKHLVELGLIERESSGADQRVMRYRLSPAGQRGLLRIGRAVVQQMGQLVIGLSLPQTGNEEDHPGATEARQKRPDQAPWN